MTKLVRCVLLNVLFTEAEYFWVKFQPVRYLLLHKMKFYKTYLLICLVQSYMRRKQTLKAQALLTMIRSY